MDEVVGGVASSEAGGYLVGIEDVTTSHLDFGPPRQIVEFGRGAGQADDLMACLQKSGYEPAPDVSAGTGYCDDHVDSVCRGTRLPGIALLGT